LAFAVVAPGALVDTGLQDTVALAVAVALVAVAVALVAVAVVLVPVAVALVEPAVVVAK
jgi:hypothetical protein